MQKIKISTAQFEHRNGDKLYHLEIIEKLSEQVAKDGSQVVAFHECSITVWSK
jgi:predicted amidohydrolase